MWRQEDSVQQQLAKFCASLCSETCAGHLYSLYLLLRAALTLFGRGARPDAPQLEGGSRIWVPTTHVEF